MMKKAIIIARVQLWRLVGTAIVIIIKKEVNICPCKDNEDSRKKAPEPVPEET